MEKEATWILYLESLVCEGQGWRYKSFQQTWKTLTDFQSENDNGSRGYNSHPRTINN